MRNIIKRLLASWRRYDEIGDRAEREFDAAVTKWEQEMMSLPIDEAQLRALPLLDDRRYYHCERSAPSHEDAKRLRALPPHVRGLLEAYKSITSVQRYDALDRSEISEAELPEGVAAGGYFRIGASAGGHDVILVRPPEEAIYLNGDASYGQEGPVRFCESVYHYLLYIYAISKPEVDP